MSSLSKKIIFLDQEFPTIRRDYQQSELNEQDLLDSPIEMLWSWINYAYQQQVSEPNAFALATTDNDHAANCRIVLLKAISAEYLYFFTNYQSQKAKEIDCHNLVAMNFFWPDLERQVRVRAKISKGSRELSMNYFNSRPIKSRLAAIASEQSVVLSSRQQLESKLSSLVEKHQDRDPVCPENWGAYQLSPLYFEFWQGQRNRLHDRLVYENQNTVWNRYRLSP